MSNRNQHWYGRNENSAYPIIDTASCVDDSGAYLPSNIITDINVRWPAVYGLVAFMSGVVVSERAVSVILDAAPSRLSPGDFTPLAVITVIKPVEEGIQYALSPQIPGCAGWIVFGSGINTEYRGRFSGPLQTMLSPNAARTLNQIPVRSFSSVYSGKKMEGIVRLSAEPPLQITAQTRNIGGADRDVIVFELVQQDATSGFSQSALEVRLNEDKRSTNVLEDFAGNCGKRPESNNCGEPIPIELVNGVAPDCDGVLTLEFRGCAVVSQLTEPCGLVVECDRGGNETCKPPRIPDALGRLPDEYDPGGTGGGGNSNTDIVGPTDTLTDPPTVVLPYTDCFNTGTAADFDVESGSFGFVSGGSEQESDFCDTPPLDPHYSYVATNIHNTNISLWRDGDTTTAGRRYVTDMLMDSTSTGLDFNGGVVVNYRPHASVPDRFVYWVAYLDYATQSFSLARYNGLVLSAIVTQIDTRIVKDNWYRITVTVNHGVRDDQVVMTAQATGLEDAVNITLGPVTISNYYPSTGFSGLYSARAKTKFSYWRVEDSE